MDDDETPPSLVDISEHAELTPTVPKENQEADFKRVPITIVTGMRPMLFTDSITDRRVERISRRW